MRGEQARAAAHATCVRWWRFGTLTASMAGSQVIWSLEIAYGTPYLLAIGLSKQATSLVWIAGPLSGLLMQPLIGSLSDASTSKYRRRKYMVASALFVALSTCLIAFSEPVAILLLDLLGVGLGDWDPVRRERTAQLVQVLSVLGFWVLDFAINGLQVISRALILDSADSAEQNEANAWQARMLHVGNIVGYWCGWVNLGEWPTLHWVGGGQFRKLSVLALIVMGITVAVTCVCTPETEYQHTTPPPTRGWQRVCGSLRQIWHVACHLPLSIRRATMSWFPFLFYSTTYIVDVARRSGIHRRAEDEEKTGSLGMLLFAFVSIASGTLLPLLTHAGTHTPQDTPDAPPRPVHMWQCVRLRTMWTAGALAQAVLLFGTFVVTTQTQAIALVTLMGIPWSIWTWVPFALLGEFVREAESIPAQDTAEEQWSAQQIMDRPERGSRTSAHDTDSGNRHSYSHEPSQHSSDSTRIVSGSFVSSIVSRGRQLPGDVAPSDDSIRGGTILGIHNLAVVVPQLLVALISSLIFRVTSTAPRKHHPATDGDVAWVLRFGALMAIGAALLTRCIPLTQSERRASRSGYVPLLDDDDDVDDAEASVGAPPHP
ncbi:hypothetical protein CBS14141_003632 [Malassezia furfur]|nr:hypothetical protein CBS14141_003632 [Malassezia furfur]